MRAYIGGHEAVSDLDFAELALGTPPELWLGVEGESEEERAARLDAARGILAEDPGMPERLAALVPPLDDLAAVIALRPRGGAYLRAVAA